MGVAAIVLRLCCCLLVWAVNSEPIILKLHQPVKPSRKIRSPANITLNTTTLVPSLTIDSAPVESQPKNLSSHSTPNTEPQPKNMSLDQSQIQAKIQDSDQQSANKDDVRTKDHDMEDLETATQDDNLIQVPRNERYQRSTSKLKEQLAQIPRKYPWPTFKPKEFSTPLRAPKQQHGNLSIPWRSALGWLSTRSQQHSNILPASLTVAASLFVVHTVRSEPVRRAAYFWYKMGPIVVHYKFTQWWMNHRYADNRHVRDQVYKSLHDRYSRPVMDMIVHLRGLYVKIGQVLSSRPDFMPPQYINLFETLQDAIPQWPIEQVQDILSCALEQEFGLTFEQVFEHMDATALGSASIGQAHRAILRDPWAQLPGYQGGKVVAVKVMHPGAKQRFMHDFQVFRWLVRLVIPTQLGLLTEIERRIMTEFDYRVEASSLEQVRENMVNSPYRYQVSVPEPLERLCCKQVLVMEMLNGIKLSNAIEDDLAGAFGGREKAARFLSERKRELMTGTQGDSSSLLASVGLIGKIKLYSLVRKCRQYIKLLVDVHGSQIFVDGIFNGDPHRGNVLRLDNGRLGLIDYGQTRRLSDSERLGIARIVAALGQESGSYVIAKAMRDLGFRTELEQDDATMVKYAKLFFDSDQESEDLGFATPQHYFTFLMQHNRLTDIPDAAIFVARTSFLFRGMGHAIGSDQIRTSKQWWPYAHQALVDANIGVDSH